MSTARIAGAVVIIVSLGFFASGVIVAATRFFDPTSVISCYMWAGPGYFGALLLVFGLPGGGAGIIGGTALMLHGKPGRPKGFRRTMLTLVAGVILIIFLSYAAVASTFGVYSTFTSVPMVSVSSVSCTGSQTVACSLILTNMGSAPAQMSGGAQITFGGHSTTGMCNQETLNPGTTNSVECSFQVGGLVPGIAVYGIISLANEAPAGCGGTQGSWMGPVQFSSVAT